MSDRDDWENQEEFDVYRVIGETPLAWHLDLGDGVVDWFPKSKCELEMKNRSISHPKASLKPSFAESKPIAIITVPEWLAIEKGLV